MWSGAESLSTVWKKAEPGGGKQLLEEVCLEGAQLTEEKQKKLAVVLEAHARAFSPHDMLIME